MLFNNRTSRGNGDADAMLKAVARSRAMIEFDLSGNILDANDNFCATVGYDLSEIQGKHHSMFVDPEYGRSTEYREFWDKLRRGEFQSNRFRRFGKGGKEIWIQASYDPVLDGSGKPYKVVKFATDITEEQIHAADVQGKLDAISRAQAIIEFDPKGNILTANENFCGAMGYDLSEIKGRHHSMFVDPAYAQSSEYKLFWDKLRNGEFAAEEFKRFAKGGKEIWIQASYNPIFDASGNVFKVVKFATDITGRVRAVNEIAAGLQRLSDGDLGTTIDEPFIPSLDKLRVDFNNALDQLSGTIQSIGNSASQIMSGSEEIKAASGDLAKGSETQAASVEETAAAIEEITSGVKASTDRAEEAGRLVEHTKQNAERSGEVVGEAVVAMGRIEKSSTEIANIIGLIDDIAFQTNLLALNAGVEAARAGDAGKGFAVVAQEVRELAQRSANAAKEIKSLITQSGEEVKAGVSLVNDTGKALETIVQEIQTVTEHVQAIVETAREQSSGLSEVNVAVGAIDQGTQRNASMAEQTTAASHSLTEEVVSINNMLSEFKTKGGMQMGQPKVADKPREQREPAGDARALGKRVASAFNGNAALKEDDWEEF